jgi:hypothetical protein
VKYDAHEEMTELLYSADVLKTKLSSWSGRKSTHFIYVDSTGGQHDTWPPHFGIWPQLPDMILLQFEKDGEPHMIAAVPRSSREAKVPTLDMTGTPF